MSWPACHWLLWLMLLQAKSLLLARCRWVPLGACRALLLLGVLRSLLLCAWPGWEACRTSLLPGMLLAVALAPLGPAAAAAPGRGCCWPRGRY